MLTPILLSLCFSQLGDGSAITPKPREEAWWLQRVTKIQNEVDNSRKNASVIFVGDSITQGWEGSGEAVWDSAFNMYGALNLGIGGDRTEHVLWRLEHGHLDGIEPQLAVVMIGTNNFGGGQDSIDEVYEGVVAVVKKLTEEISGVHVLLLDIFPRGESFNKMRGDILQVNQALQATYADVKNVTFLPIGDRFLENDGTISTKIMPDFLHLSSKGYQQWADAITPTISMLLGSSVTLNPQSQNRKPNSLKHHKPNLNRPGPWDHDVDVFQVEPKGTVTKLSTFQRAGVPTIGLMKDGRLIAAHQWFPENDDENFDKIAVVFSSDNGKTWSAPRPMEFEGLDEKARYPFDPTIAVLEDGRIRLYFTYMVGSRIFEEATPGITSAISEDGIHFVKEKGMRLAVEDMPVIDCAAFKYKNNWHLISPFQDDNVPKAYHATSKDGVTFKRTRDISFNQSFKWLGCMVNEGNKLLFYGTRHHGGPPNGRGIPALSSSNGSRWNESSSILINGADPGVAVLEDGTKIVVVTTMAREGTTSHEQMQNRIPKR